MQQYAQDQLVVGHTVGWLCLDKSMIGCQSSVVGLACQQEQAVPVEAVYSSFAQRSPFGLPAQQVFTGEAAACGQGDAFPATRREGSCVLPETPQPGKPLPAIRTRTCDSDMCIATPVAAPEHQQHQQPEQDWSQPCAGWFFSCRGCGCMTAYEQQFAGVEVPFCRRCQVLLVEAKPAMQQKMVDTLLYVHHAWSKAGL